MNNENTKLEQQDAPEKNGDNAFVQVGADGKPVMPQTQTAQPVADVKTPKEGTLADR